MRKNKTPKYFERNFPDLQYAYEIIGNAKEKNPVHAPLNVYTSQDQSLKCFLQVVFCESSYEWF